MQQPGITGNMRRERKRVICNKGPWPDLNQGQWDYIVQTHKDHSMVILIRYFQPFLKKIVYSKMYVFKCILNVMTHVHRKLQELKMNLKS